MTDMLTVGYVATIGKHFRNIHTKEFFVAERRGEYVCLVSLGTGPGQSDTSITCDIVASAPAERLLRRFDPYETPSDQAFVRAIDDIEGSSIGSEHTRITAMNALRLARAEYDAHRLRKCLDLLELVAELERNETGEQYAYDALTRSLFTVLNVPKPACPACTLLGEQCALCAAGITVPPDMDARVAVELGSLLREGAHHAGYREGERFPIDVAMRRARESS